MVKGLQWGVNYSILLSYSCVTAEWTEGGISCCYVKENWGKKYEMLTRDEVLRRCTYMKLIKTCLELVSVRPLEFKIRPKLLTGVQEISNTACANGNFC